jgi:hypothetical protein
MLLETECSVLARELTTRSMFQMARTVKTMASRAITDTTVMSRRGE